ncbi:MAG: phosphoserine transaminase [Candidatus Puniceispirillales bacterium]
MKYPNIPQNPNFSSGPCAKYKNWSLDKLSGALIGRSHRSKNGKKKLKICIEGTKSLLNLPSEYLLGILPGSNTGAFEIALWNFLGSRQVDILAWESFGHDWVNDITNQLKLSKTKVLKAEYGLIPDLKKVNFKNDVVFTWNGTTSGVCLPNANWIENNREGLTICDGTSAIFAVDIDWQKIDIFTFSWQKALGGEGAHGMIILSPRAVDHINKFTPLWPMPKLFNLKKNNKLNLGIFEGVTINTPSMLVVEDWLTIIDWANSNGGLEYLKLKTKENFQVINKFCNQNDWIDFLAPNKLFRSNTSVCLKFIDPWFNSLNEKTQNQYLDKFLSFLEDHNAAFDIKSYRTAPLGLRIWCGPTVEKDDLKLLTEWLSLSWRGIYKK